MNQLPPITHRLTVLTGEGIPYLDLLGRGYVETPELFGPRRQVAFALELVRDLIRCPEKPPTVLITQSHWVMMSIYNCIQGHNALMRNPIWADQIKERVAPIPFEDVMVYDVLEDGTFVPCMDQENRLIDETGGDQVDTELAEQFDYLLDLELQTVTEHC